MRATADGELSGAAIGAGYGRAVVLNYGHDVMRAYGHLSAIAVVAGQTGRARPIPVCTSRRKCIMSVNSNRYLRTAYAQATNWQGIRAVAERQPRFDSGNENGFHFELSRFILQSSRPGLAD